MSNVVWDAGIGFPSGGRTGMVEVGQRGGWGLICGFVQAWLGWEGGTHRDGVKNVSLFL